jgi:hypothetical protein
MAMHLRHMHALVVEGDGRARHGELRPNGHQRTKIKTRAKALSRRPKPLQPCAAPARGGRQRRFRCRSAFRRTGLGRGSCDEGGTLLRMILRRMSREQFHKKHAMRHQLHHPTREESGHPRSFGPKRRVSLHTIEQTQPGTSSSFSLFRTNASRIRASSAAISFC